MVHDGLWDAYNDYHMGNTGENVAEKYHITREEQDEYALNSHRKAVSAINECRFKDQIVPVELPSKKKGAPPVRGSRKDESPREDTSIEVLRSLKPAFKKDGTVTAGNAPGVNDGAAALVLMSAAKAKELGLKPMARIVAQATSGLAPEWVMMTPVETDSPAVEEDGMEERGRRSLRDQRGVLGGGDRGDARAGNRSQQGQRERRRSRAGTSDRRQRRAHPDHAAV